MSTIEEAVTSGLTTGSGWAPPFDWQSAPLTQSHWMTWRGTFIPSTGQATQSRRVSIVVHGRDASTIGLAAVVERWLNELLAMKPGWDSGRGAELAEDAVKAAVPMMFGILRDRVLAPQVFLLSDGGLQLEWHVDGNSIELEVEPDGSAFATAESREGILLEEDVNDLTVAKLREFLLQIAAVPSSGE
jgi:hypothetical protein